jgi:hypothetical protein
MTENRQASAHPYTFGRDDSRPAGALFSACAITVEDQAPQAWKVALTLGLRNVPAPADHEVVALRNSDRSSDTRKAAGQVYRSDPEPPAATAVRANRRRVRGSGRSAAMQSWFGGSCLRDAKQD